MTCEGRRNGEHEEHKGAREKKKRKKKGPAFDTVGKSKGFGYEDAEKGLQARRVVVIGDEGFEDSVR